MSDTVQLRSTSGKEISYHFSNGREVRITATGSTPLPREDAEKIVKILRHPLEIVELGADKVAPAPAAPVAPVAAVEESPEADLYAAAGNESADSEPVDEPADETAAPAKPKRR